MSLRFNPSRNRAPATWLQRQCNLFVSVHQLPFTSFFEIETNRDSSPGLTFEVLLHGECPSTLKPSDGAVAVVSQTGQVATFSRPGLTIILVTHSENGVNQSVAVLVEVAPIAHLSILPAAMLWPPAAKSTAPFSLPIGITAEFHIRLHDRYGRNFHSANGVVFTERLHRFDVVRIKPGAINTTYLVTATNEGNVILRVSIEDHRHAYTADFIRIRVISAIYPGYFHPCLSVFLMTVKEKRGEGIMAHDRVGYQCRVGLRFFLVVEHER